MKKFLLALLSLAAALPAQETLRVDLSGDWRAICRSDPAFAAGGNPCHETASAPTIKNSTLFEFKHSINSFKSRLSGICSRSFADFEEHLDSLPRGQLREEDGIGLIRRFEAVEYPDYLLHRLILRDESLRMNHLGRIA